MPDKKSQHFVPQFYLRNFSSDRRKCIGLYNIPSDRLVPWGASIRDQACKDYFYGKDANLEDAFNILETAASRVISDIINNNKLPNRNNEDYRTLTTFMSIQDSRTVNSTGRINDTLNAFRRVAELNFTTNKDRPERGLENRLHEAKPLEILMKGALFTEPLLLDLKDKLIVNKSLIPFITSDHPLVKHNQLYIRMENIPIGLACEGIQLFFPISPEHMIVLYDDSAYRVGQKHSKVVYIRSEEEIKLINAMQWAVANENLYFSQKTDTTQLREERATNISFRNDCRYQSSFVMAENDVYDTNTFLRVEQKWTYRVNIAAFRPIIKPRKLAFGDNDCLRNPSWLHYVTDLAKQVEAGLLTTNEFLSMTSKPYRANKKT